MTQRATRGQLHHPLSAVEIFRTLERLVDDPHTLCMLAHSEEWMTQAACASLGIRQARVTEADLSDGLFPSTGAVVLSLHRTDPSLLALAAAHAHERQIPLIVEVNGGCVSDDRARRYRESVEQLQPTILTGSDDEISALARSVGPLRGSVLEARDAALRLVRFAQVVHSRGDTDLIIGNQRECFIVNGHPFMQRLPGIGMLRAALIGALSPILKNGAHSAAVAASLVSLAAEIAGEQVVAAGRGLGLFSSLFLDVLSSITVEEISLRLKLALPTTSEE